MNFGADLVDESEHVGAGRLSSVDEKICVAIGDHGVTNAKTFELELVDHAAGGSAGRIFEDAAGTFLIERLGGAAFFIADFDSGDDFLVGLGGKLELDAKHDVVGSEGCVAVVEADLIALESFVGIGGSAVELHFANPGTDLSAVSAGVHTESAADGARNADEAFHAAAVVFGAEGDGAAEVGRSVDVSDAVFHGHAGLARGEMQDDPVELAIVDKNVGATAEEFVGDAFVAQLAHDFGERVVIADEQLVGGAADAEGGMVRESNARADFDAECREAIGDGFVANAHAGRGPFLMWIWRRILRWRLRYARR